MSDIVIQVENLSKEYRIGGKKEPYKTLRDSITDAVTAPFRRLRAGRGDAPSEAFLALKDVSFDVKRGEVLGVIGRNGAGKSTLLKVLSRITEPTKGVVRLKGRVGSLLEVGTGFHPELTGRENIYLNGAILGMRRREITSKFDEIVAFAEVEQFIDTPVKRYSSGMYMRMAFSVAAHLEPEILLVDEVLAVGDVSFQRKCLGKMSSVANEGRTVLFVSHNMEAILGLCQRVIWLGQGQLQMDGEPQATIQQYSAAMMRNIGADNLLERSDRKGTGEIRFSGFHMTDADNMPIPQPVTGQPVNLVVEYQSSVHHPNDLQAAIIVTDFMHQPKLVLASNMTGDMLTSINAAGNLVCHVPRWPLKAGEYIINLRLYKHKSLIDAMDQAVYIETASGDFYGSGGRLWNENTVLIDFKWSHGITDNQ